MLDLVPIRNEDAAALAAYFDARRKGRSPHLPAFEAHRAGEIVLRPPPGTSLHCDDAVLHARDAVIRIAGQMRVLVPAPR